MKDFTIDFIANTITLSRAFYEASKNFGSNEYAQLHEVMAQNRNMNVVVRSVRRQSGCNSRKGLTYRYMRRFIAILDRENLVTFDNTMLYYESLYSDNLMVYQKIADWFLDNYPAHKDMVVAAAPKKIVAALPITTEAAA